MLQLSPGKIRTRPIHHHIKAAIAVLGKIDQCANLRLYSHIRRLKAGTSSGGFYQANRLQSAAPIHVRNHNQRAFPSEAPSHSLPRAATTSASHHHNFVLNVQPPPRGLPSNVSSGVSMRGPATRPRTRYCPNAFSINPT